MVLSTSRAQNFTKIYKIPHDRGWLNPSTRNVPHYPGHTEISCKGYARVYTVPLSYQKNRTRC